MKSGVTILLTATAIFAIGIPFVLSDRSGTDADGVGVDSESILAAADEATTADAQGFDQLERSLARLRSQAETMRVDELRQETLAQTTDFLGFDDARRARFTKHVEAALASLAAARTELFATNNEVAAYADEPEGINARKEAWSRWQASQTEAADNLLGALEAAPRDALFAEKRKIWLLRLDSSLQAAQPR